MIHLLNLFCFQWHLLRIMFTRAQKRKLVQKKLSTPQKKSLCNRGKGTSFFSSFIFRPLCEPTAFIHQWSKYDTVQKFSSFLIFLRLCGPIVFFTIFIK